MRARRVEDRMMNFANMEGERETANERNFGQRMASPGNLGDEIGSRKESLVDGQPLINNHRTVNDCDLTQ